MKVCMFYRHGISAVSAFKYLRDSIFTKLIDMRSPEQIFVTGIPDTSTCKKSLCWLPWREDTMSSSETKAQDVFLNRLNETLKNEGKNNDPILLFICRRGHSSLEAAELANEVTKNICYSIDGGFSGLNGWLDSSLPVKSFISLN